MWVLAEAGSRAIEIDLTGRDLFWWIGGLIAIVAILSGTISSMMNVRARERTRREIAAYVAEGSIDPNEAVKMLKAGSKLDACDDE